MTCYFNIVLAAVLGGLVTLLMCVRWFEQTMTKQRRLIARYVRDQLNKQSQAALGHALALQIGGKDYDAT